MEPSYFEGQDGARLAYREMGEGAPVILLHGLFSTAEINWIKFGHARRIAEAGFRVIMPDLRAHGDSAKPHDPAGYPPNVLVRDVEALAAHLRLDCFDLGGFSLGARTTARAIVAGIRPRRAVLAGMGLEGLAGWGPRRGFFSTAIANFDTAKRGDPHWLAIQFMKSNKVDRVAAKLLLDSFAEVDELALELIGMPTLVVCGADDRDNGSAPALAERLDHASYREIPGTHMSSVTRPELGAEIAAFLAA